MTLIQPHQQKSFFLGVIAALFVLLFTGVVWLILLYNQGVEFRHASLDFKAEVQKVETEHADAKERILSMTNSSDVAAFVAIHNLVQDKTPHYLRTYIDSQWAFASGH